MLPVDFAIVGKSCFSVAIWEMLYLYSSPGGWLRMRPCLGFSVRAAPAGEDGGKILPGLCHRNSANAGKMNA
jgi:hypothetical protein